MDAHYALFAERLPPDLTWAAVGRSACGELDTTRRTDRLFDVLIEMARTLDDGHVWLEAEPLDRAEDAWASGYAYTGELAKIVPDIERHDAGSPLERAAEGAFRWGEVDGVRYLSITRLDELAPYAEDQDEEPRDLQAAAAAMEHIMAQLSPLRGIVVDVREHERGWDAVALEVATWFAGPRTRAWSKQVRNGPDHRAFGPWVDTFVPAGRHDAYPGDVAVLTGGSTFSAGETSCWRCGSDQVSSSSGNRRRVTSRTSGLPIFPGGGSSSTRGSAIGRPMK